MKGPVPLGAGTRMGVPPALYPICPGAHCPPHHCPLIISTTTRAGVGLCGGTAGAPRRPLRAPPIPCKLIPYRVWYNCLMEQRLFDPCLLRESSA